MSMEYIRKHYGVPAKRGVVIQFCGKPCVITGSSGAYLRVKSKEDSRKMTLHPTWEVEYPDESHNQSRKI